MRTFIALALFASIVLIAPRSASAVPVLIDNAACPVSVSAIEQIARKLIYRQRKARRYYRRYDWTARPYWRPYQYRYWKFYYPYGGPLF